MSGPPADIHDLILLDDIADCMPDIRGNGNSRVLTIEVLDIRSKFSASCYSSRGQNLVSGLLYEIKGHTGLTPICITVANESDNEFKEEGPSGLGGCQVHSMHDSELNEEHYEIEATVFLPMDTLRVFRDAIKFFTYQEMPISMTVSVPVDENHEFLWIERLYWL